MKYIFTLVLLIVTSLSFSQRVKTESGDIAILAGEKELSVTFGYENMMVEGFESEEAFILEKVAIRENNNKGSGKQFRGSWFADRDTVFEPTFIKYFNDQIPKKRKVNIEKNNPNANYNLHVQTLWTYSGYNVGWTSPAKIEVALTVYEIGNPQNVLWKSNQPIRVQAKAAPMKREWRIAAAYAELSRRISWFFKRKVK